VGLQAGLYSSLEDVSANWQCDHHVEPNMDAQSREQNIAGWKKAVSKVLTVD